AERAHRPSLLIPEEKLVDLEMAYASVGHPPAQASGHRALASFERLRGSLADRGHVLGERAGRELAVHGLEALRVIARQEVEPGELLEPVRELPAHEPGGLDRNAQAVTKLALVDVALGELFCEFDFARDIPAYAE